MNPRNLTSILVVDDDDVDRERIRRLLADDFEITEASSVGEACECLEAGTFDCILLDYELPDGVGMDLLRQVQKDETGVLMLTGHDRTDVAVGAFKQGADDFLSKNQISRDRLERKILDVIEKSRLSEELSRKRRQIHDFAYQAAREIQSPLRRIVRFCQHIREESGTQLSGRLLESLDIAAENSVRLQHLVEDLLGYAEFCNSDHRVEAIDLNRLVAEIVPLFLDTEKRVEFEIGDLPEIQGDPAAIRQLFLNLISNGVKFCDAEVPEIQIGCQEAAGIREYFVRDNGVGIEPRYHEMIFSPLKRLNQKEVEGVGLGLSLCQQIVEQHGGEIRVESEPGRGSTFIFTLPG